MAWIELGRLGAPYGTKGWLHVASYTDPPDGLLKYREWALRLASGERVTHRLATGRGHGRGLVARLEGVASREGAAALTGAIVEVERAALPPAGEHQYYRADLVGFAVRNLEGATLGTVSHFVDVFAAGKADAALAASIFHFGISSARSLKEELAIAGVPVRLPC